MAAWKIETSGVAHFLHRHLLGLIVSSYVLAAAAPGLGLWIKETRVVDVAVGPGRLSVSLPTLMLAFLLFNAGLRVRGERVRQIARRPGMMLIGVAANLAVPVLYVLTLVFAIPAWHNPEEAATILVGLALVAAMPVAGSSTGWAQNANGDMALSLGLVLASTFLSPMTTPIALKIVGSLSPVGYAEEFRQLAGRDTGAFLTTWVLLPSLLGILARYLLGESRVASVERRFKTLGTVVLLLLCYANASACLPQALGSPDWDFLAMTLAIVLGLCVSTFAAGYALARVLKADRDQRAALMFGLGMNNNGTGLVLASVALASQPLVLLPIIVYNLTQHLVAGCVNALFRRTEPC